MCNWRNTQGLVERVVGWEGGEEAGTGHHIAPLGSRSQPDSQQRASSVPFSKRFPPRYHEEEGASQR